MAEKIKNFIAKNKKWLIIGGAALVAVIALTVVIVLIAGGGEEPVSTDPVTARHTVTVTDGDGNPLQNVGVFVYVDSPQGELVWFARTDDQGKVSFTDAVSDRYIAVLSDAPKEYLVEESYPLTGENTTIALNLGRLEDNMDIALGLGDTMLDFSVTTPDGTVYTLSQLLQEKEAVVLNFWFQGCEPCKAEFPYLQAAYEAYSDKIGVLALNPVDSSTDVAAFQSQYGLTFPMAAVDAAWEDVMQLMAYPTTVVIDRNGEICLVHGAYVNESGVFETIFEFFTADAYQQTVLDSINALLGEGSVGNPIETAGVTELAVTVEPGQEIYYSIYRIGGKVFQLESEDAYVIVDGVKYTPVNGVIEFTVTASDNYTPVSIAFGNSGASVQTYNATFSSAAGSYDNPYALELGEFAVSVAEGDEQGVYYLYTADREGALNLQCLSATVGIEYDITLYNLTTYIQHNLNEDGDADQVSIEVHAGDTVQVIIAALPNEENEYPAADFQMEAGFTPSQASCSHSTTEVRGAAEATCTAAGYSGDLYCTACNAKISDGVVLSVLAHKDGNGDHKCDTCGTALITSCSHSTTEIRNKISATCTKAGYSGDTYCKSCGELLSNGTAISASGHTQQRRNAVAATCTAEGYTGDTYCSVCGTKLSAGTAIAAPGHKDSNADNKCDTCGTAMSTGTAKVTYTITVIHSEGVSTAGITIKLSGTKGTGTAVTDASGVATFELESGTYTVSIPDLGGFEIFSQTQKVSKSSPNGEIILRTAVPDGYAKLNGEVVKILSTGSNTVELKSGQTTYFIFEPSQSGKYKVSCGYTLSYYGTNTNYIQDLTSTVEAYATTSYILNIKDSNLSASFIIGVTAPSGVTGGTVTVTRTGDAELSISDLSYETYNGTHTPTSWAFSGGTLTYVDITGSADSYQLVLGSDGYYHLNSANGPVLYLNLSTNAKYADLSFATILNSERPVIQTYVYGDNGEFVAKEDYTQLVQKYISCSSNGLYRLTEDLVRILTNYSRNNGWDNFLSSGTDSVNSDLAWMCNVCYVAE